MPELPEVETIKLGLQTKIIGLKLKEIEILNAKSFFGDPSIIKDKTVTNVWRKAKVLGIELGELVLIFHLKMSGQVIFEGKEKFIGGHPTLDMLGNMPNKSTRVIFTFEDGSKIYFNDQRKFGWVKLLKKEEIKEESFLKRLGPEPLEKDFSVKVLKTQLQRRKTLPVKVAILDQEIISGVGNIYAAEAVFIAKIDPRKKVKDLTDEDYINLHKGIVESLSDGVKYKGSSSVHFVDVEGIRGSFLDHAYVYKREGQPCKVCGTILSKIRLGGRGTVFCEVCQK